MGFLNSITWGKQPQQQQQPQQGQQPQQQQPANQPAHQPNQNNGVPNGGGGAGPVGNQMNGPANSQMNPGGNPANPLDPFVDLMTPKKEVVDARAAQKTQQEAPLFGDQFTPDNIKAHVGKTDFMAGADPELVQKALGGDAQAFAAVINSSIQNAVATSIQMSQGMVEHGVKTGSERFGSTLDSRIRNFQLNSQTSKNPALQHPIGKALLSTVARQIAEANPKMSPEDVTAKSEEMFTQFAGMLAPQKSEDGKSGSKKEETDWMAFLQ